MSDAVARVCYREILEGDRAKLRGESNIDPAAGGGAKDFRFPHRTMGPVFRKMFPGTKAVTRKRNGERVLSEAYAGQLWWFENGVEQNVDVEYELPTDERPSEGRMPRVASIEYLGRKLPDVSAGPAFLLFVQERSGKVFAYYATQSQLQSGAWNSDIATAILDSKQSAAPNKAAFGYIDYMTQRRMSNGK